MSGDPARPGQSPRDHQGGPRGEAGNSDWFAQPHERGWANYHRHVVAKKTYTTRTTTFGMRFGAGRDADTRRKRATGFGRNTYRLLVIATGCLRSKPERA